MAVACGGNGDDDCGKKDVQLSTLCKAFNEPEPRARITL